MSHYRIPAFQGVPIQRSDPKATPGSLLWAKSVICKKKKKVKKWRKKTTISGSLGDGAAAMRLLVRCDGMCISACVCLCHQIYSHNSRLTRLVHVHAVQTLHVRDSLVCPLSEYKKILCAENGNVKLYCHFHALGEWRLKP